MASTQRNARLIKRGDVIQTTSPDGSGLEEVVREVQVVAHLANGTSVVLPLDEPVTVVTDDSINEDLAAQIEQMQSQD